MIESWVSSAFVRAIRLIVVWFKDLRFLSRDMVTSLYAYVDCSSGAPVV